jgi:hypothetical protein
MIVSREKVSVPFGSGRVGRDENEILVGNRGLRPAIGYNSEKNQFRFGIGKGGGLTDLKA